MSNLLDADRRVIKLALARMVDSLGNSFLIIVLPLFITTELTGSFFGLTETLITGIVLSMFGFINSFAQPFAGRYSDRVGKRKVFVLAGLLILAGGNIVYLFASNYYTLIAIRAVQGLGVALTIPAVIALINEYSTNANRGGSMGTYNTFQLLGFGLGPILAGAILSIAPFHVAVAGQTVTLSGFESAFYIATIATILSLFLVWAFVEDPEETRATAGEEFELTIFATDSDKTLDPVITLALASLFMAIGIALLETLQKTVNQRLDQTAFLFSIEFAAFIIPQSLLQAPIGRASDVYGRRRFIIVGLLLLAPATLAQGLVMTPIAMIAARALQGIAGAMVFAPALALAGDLTKQGQSGSQLSLVTMMFSLGVAIGPLASGYLVNWGFVVPFAFGAVLALIGAILVITQVEEPNVAAGDSASMQGQPTVQD